MNPFKLAPTAAVLACFVNTASSHLTMQKPVPFSKDLLTLDPLDDAFPGNYPCKQQPHPPDTYKISSMNFMQVGEPQELSFEGSASHGGGTCQLAVSLDKQPTANSTFKIIQVFEGGCPIDANGNSGTHPFTFTIPEGFPNGVSTFAWYWNNRIGNREAYMNCAPITVSGGSDDLDYYDSLPNLFLANLPSSDCESPDSKSVTIPNPGQFILKDPANSLAAPSGPKCSAYAASQTEGVQGYKSETKSNIAATKAPAGNAGFTGKPQPDATSSPENGGGSGAPAATSAPATTSADSGLYTMSTAVSSAAASSAAPASSAAASSYAEPSASSSAAGVSASSGAAAPTGSSPSGSCSGNSDSIQCSDDGKEFGMCTDDGEMVWQAVAPGTKCQNGSIVKRDGLAEFKNPHVRRHARGAGVHRWAEF